MIDAKELYFLQYLDKSTGELREDAPEQAKKDFRNWQNTPRTISNEDKKFWEDSLKRSK